MLADAKKSKGFTLIELMVVVAIIGILATIAIGAYQQYLQNSANTACLSEAKAINYRIIVNLANSEPVGSYNTSSCARVTFTDSVTDVTAFPVSPGNYGVRCPMDYSGSCYLDETITN